jgi:hypothetical protein
MITMRIESRVSCPVWLDLVGLGHEDDKIMNKYIKSPDRFIILPLINTQYKYKLQ